MCTESSPGHRMPVTAGRAFSTYISVIAAISSLRCLPLSLKCLKTSTEIMKIYVKEYFPQSQIFCMFLSNSQDLRNGNENESTSAESF